MESIIYNVPAATPVTTPADVTVASVVFLLIQVPPVVESDNVMVLATQTALLPVICDIVSVRFTFTLIESTIEQPFPLVTVYFTVVVPADLVWKIPVLLTIVATVGLELVQAPPEVLSVYKATAPTQDEFVPTIGFTVGNEFTVTLAVTV